MKKRGFTLIELLVVIAIIAMLLAILMPALNKVKKIAQRVVCGTNLKGLGTAQTVYANDYDDEYAVQGQGGAHTWVDGVTTGTPFQNQTLNWKTAGNITIGASLYLLVREADVSPKSFICPSSDQQEFSGKNINNVDITQLWDFGYPVASGTLPAEGPAVCVSYSYHQPYAAAQSGAASTGSKGRYAADGSRSAAFAMMADQNPYFEEKLTRGSVTQENYMDHVTLLGGPGAPADLSNLDKWRKDCANALPHSREGQNILFGDGHSAYEQRTDVGVKNDGVYTKWANGGLSETDRKAGTYITDRGLTVTPAGNEDSVLVNDGNIAP